MLIFQILIIFLIYKNLIMIKSFDEALKIILKQEPLAIFQGKGQQPQRLQAES